MGMTDMAKAPPRTTQPFRRASGHVVADQSEAAAFLAAPATHGGAAVERIDTHAAMVFLAGGRAYKIKRAVKFPYMDFSTLELRRANCEQEVALNRRTAPDLYLGAVPIVRGERGLGLGGDGEVIEWVVAMRRFDQDGLFDRLAERGALTPVLMRAAADAAAALHADAEVLQKGAGGGAAGMAWVVDDNIEEFGERRDLFASPGTASLATAARAALARLTPLLDRRMNGGFVRRCHGDLHLRNICLIDGRPTLFDAIEFNDRLSCIDVLYDLAFLLMDLEHRGLRPFANLVFNRYLGRSADVAGLAALPLFLSSRAAVRAKVSASAEASQQDGAAAGRLREEARVYFAAAAAYLTPPPPRLIAIGGLSGTGKTGLAHELAPGLGAAPGALHLRSDVMRKFLAGVEEEARLPAAAYKKEASRVVYDRLAARARAALEAGHSVILDAVHAKPHERAAVEALARGAGVPFAGLWLDAPAALLMDRVAARTGDASDAMPAVVRRQLGYELGDITWRRLDAAAPRDQVAEAAAQILKFEGT